MKYEDAIVIAKAILESGTGKSAKTGFELMMFDVYTTALEAIEKQIPKKPYAETEFYGACPSCGRTIDTEFCQYCGQAIAWSEVE